MKEKDIQNYLYEHPEYLFPNKIIQEKAKEYLIKSKRIDLLFRVDGLRYIVEIKNSALKREHIGQLVEYYGLMKSYLNEANLKLILVTPFFEDWQKTYLEELNIRCVHFEDNIVSAPLESKNNYDSRNNLVSRNESIKYWAAAIDYKESLTELVKEAEKDLKSLFNDNNSCLNIISFPKDFIRSFVSKAAVGDYVLLVINKYGNYRIAPFRKIIKKIESGSNIHFYLEATQESIKKIMSFDEFSNRLKENKIKFNISKRSTKLIPEKYINQISLIW